MKSIKNSFLIIFLVFFVVGLGWNPSNRVQAQVFKPLGSILALNTDSEGDKDSMVTIEASQPIQYTAYKLLNPLRLVLDFQNMQKGDLSGKIQVKKGLVNSIRPLQFEETGVLRLEISLREAVDYEILKPAANILSVFLQSETLELARSGQLLEGNNELKKEEVGYFKYAATILTEQEKIPDDTCYPLLYGVKETITLDFQDADIRNLIRIFTHISGLNFILSSELTGTVNMRMTDIPWNQALEVILSNNGLGRECRGKNIVRIAAQKTLDKEESARTVKKAIKAADLAKQKTPKKLVTEVVRINNANILELSASLNALKSTRVDAGITVDARTNTIILNDLYQHVEEMLETIRVLDVATPQVLIEAKIVEISKSFNQELRTQSGLAGTLTQTNNLNGASLASSDFGTNFLVDLPQSTKIGMSGAEKVSGFDLTLAKGISLAAQLEILEKQGKARILSSPKVTTADNKEARITSSRKIPYQTVSKEGTTIEFVDAGLGMKVLPHVTFDEKVYMTIDTTNNVADFSNQVKGIPTITTKKFHSEVLVGNGDTTVLGGIYTSNINPNKKVAPFFSRIPFLGVLFRDLDDSETVSELLVFVTPTIVDNGYN